MYQRSLTLPKHSVFLFGPRGTGKSTWLSHALPKALTIDLLDLAMYGELLMHPERLEGLIAASKAKDIVIDEVQRLPALLDEVHRLIERKKHRFVLTGSSARKLRRGGTNLLAGRARTLAMHPLTARELGDDFDVKHSLRYGHLPTAYTTDDPSAYLKSYVGTYLREEVQAEALTRNLEAFSRFLTAASLSQGSVLSMASIARDVSLNRKTVENYFDLLEDLLLSVRLPVFSRKAKRAVVAHPKFYFFDVGVYRAIRPRGPLDAEEEIEGAAIETLIMQELRAENANHDLGYELSYWHTREHDEVDFVLYGERGLVAVEVKRSHRLRDEDLATLRLFGDDYPSARRHLFYGGARKYVLDGIHVWPLAIGLRAIPDILAGE